MTSRPYEPRSDHRAPTWASGVNQRKDRDRPPRILMVTPEITYLPAGMGNLAQRMSAKAGGLADVSASLVQALYDLGADVHVALPNYRRMFDLDVKEVFNNEYEKVARSLPPQRIHLAEDRVFYYKSQVYDDAEIYNIALAFQREVINHTIPEVRPDLIHCNDWMTGLIPAVARRHGIPSLFTVHNIHTERLTLAHIEDRGIDAADFWQYLFFKNPPHSYEETREHNACDLLASGIFAADQVNTVSPTFLNEVIAGHHDFVPGHICHELWAKREAGCAGGILNAPDPSFDPTTDPLIPRNYGPDDHAEGKRDNKVALQQELGLTVNPDAPMIFWPSRLDPVQKGCQLVTEILHRLICDYEDIGLQFVVVANGSFQQHFHDIVEMHSLHDRVAVRDFNEGLSHRGYAGSDFIVMPSSFEPCGLPQMVSPKYGTLAIAHNTGGIHDTVEPLNCEADTGNGFRFDHFNGDALRWGIDQAIEFFRSGADHKKHHISRIMREASERFNHKATAQAYFERYEEMLGRPVTRIVG